MIKFIKLWILGSVACVAAGWILSAIHQLNSAGYAVAFVICLAGFVVQFRRWQRANARRAGRNSAHWRWRRFRRPLPLLFLLMAILATIGGAAYAPNNYDGLSYRFPRVLDWWSASGWYWITSPSLRMNVSGTGFEWLMLPMVILTHSDRFFFLINIAAYALLPSLVFLVFVAVGVARRVAWFWMWLLPAALCYAMQAGSISNDTIAATYFLAAIYFALRARQTGKVGNVWLALLAGGLLTGVKASNLPLMLPLAWVLWPVINQLPKQMAVSAVVILLSVLVSFVPTALLNQHYTGNWGGDPKNVEKVQVTNPVAGILGNGLQLGLQCMEPPFLPLAHSAEVWVWNRFPESIRAYLNKYFPRFGVGFRELPQEESAGMGIGIMLIAVVSLGAAFSCGWRIPESSKPARTLGTALGLLTWLALLVFMTKLGSESTSRLVAAYYPLLLLPLLLNPAQRFLVGQGWYRGLAVFAGIVALVAVFLTPSRPLWPAESFFSWAEQEFPNNAFMQHATMVFSVYRERNDLFAPLRPSIPESVRVIGLIDENDDAESSLWRPFGHRRVVHLRKNDRCQDSHIEWVVVKNVSIAGANSDAFNQWLQRNGGTVVARAAVAEKASHGPEVWSVVHFPEPKS